MLLVIKHGYTVYGCLFKLVSTLPLYSCRYIPDFMKTGRTTQNAMSIRIALFAGKLQRHPKLLPSNSQFESCVYIPCLQDYMKASCSLQLKSEKTNAAISTHSPKKILSTTLFLPTPTPTICCQRYQLTCTASAMPCRSHFSEDKAPGLHNH